MKRLLRISLDTLLMSTMPIIMWILLGIILDKNISNVFTLTYPIQFVTTLLLSIFGTGPNVNAIKNKKQSLVDSNILLGCIVGLIITVILTVNVDHYINFMSMDVQIYRVFCIYSFILMYLQLILQLICQKLYYLEKNKESNKLTITFNIINIICIVFLSYITRNQVISVICTIIVDSVIIFYIILKNVKTFKLNFEVLKNMKYVSNDIFDRLGMFLIYFIGWKNTLEFGAIYLVAINFETLIADAQWDMSYSIQTAATIDSSKDKLNFKESLRNGHKLIGLLVTSTLIMGSVLYFYYKPVLWIVAIFVGVQIFDMFLSPRLWIKQQYCQINYSPKKTTFHECVKKVIRIVTSFLPTPFCTYIGQIMAMAYQFTVFNIVYKKKYYLENGLLKMR